MPLRQRLATMHAMMMSFRSLQQDDTWKARMAATRTELRPSAEELGDILREAGEISARLSAELTP
jgi:uncharacterized protein YktB (UPF0637 family)